MQGCHTATLQSGSVQCRALGLGESPSSECRPAQMTGESDSNTTSDADRSRAIADLARCGKILVTGATGHVGNNVTRQLLDLGCELRCLIEPSDPYVTTALADLDVEIVEGDIRDPASVEAAVHGCTRVFHVAAKISTLNATRAEQRQLFDINVIGTRNVARACLESGVERMVLTGSFSAVGYDPSQPSKASNETQPFYPFNKPMPYAHSKALAEHELYKAIARGLDAVIATSCACVGPNDFLPSRMGRTLCDYARGKVWFSTDGGFDYVAARDIADGHLRAMALGRRGEKYIFSSKFQTLAELLEHFAAVTGRSRRIFVLPTRLLAIGSGIYADTVGRAFPELPQRLTPGALRILELRRHADTSKAQRELGFRPTGIREAVTDAYEFFCERGMI